MPIYDLTVVDGNDKSSPSAVCSEPRFEKEPGQINISVPADRPNTISRGRSTAACENVIDVFADNAQVAHYFAPGDIGGPIILPALASGPAENIGQRTLVIRHTYKVTPPDGSRPWLSGRIKVIENGSNYMKVGADEVVFSGYSKFFAQTSYRWAWDNNFTDLEVVVSW